MAIKRKINNLDINYTVAPHGRYFVVTIHRNEPGRIVRCYYHASKASLLRVNRAQRLLIRQVIGGYVELMPAAGF